MTCWIFLRGLMRERRHWGDFPITFSQSLDDTKVILADLPGNGRLHHLDSPSRVEHMVNFYRNELVELGMTPPYYLLALSLGGMVAAEWAHRHPAELWGCVLLNTSLRPFSPFYRRLRWHNYPAIFRLAWSSDMSVREREILRLTSNRPDATERVLNDWIMYQREYPVSRRNALTQLAAAALYCAPKKKPSVRTLILASASDRLVNHDCSRQLAQAWESDFALHPDAGHDLPLDDGNWIITQVRQWLKPYHDTIGSRA